MNVIYSKSGSTGNCHVIQNSLGDLIVLDAGIKYDTVNKAVSYNLLQASCVLQSHVHADHTAYARDFCDKCVPIFCMEENAPKGVKMPNRYVRFCKFQKQYNCGDFIFVPFPLYHTNSDGTECTNAGWLIASKTDRDKIVYATDCKYIAQRFKGIKTFLVEANYFEQEDYAEDIPYIETTVEFRRVNSHHSIESAIKFLQANIDDATENVFLIHLSTSMTETEKAKMVDVVKQSIRKGVNVYAGDYKR